MTANAPIQLLMRYRSCANALMFDALSGLPGAVLTEPQPIVFGSIIRTLSHAQMSRVTIPLPAWRAALRNFWKCHAGV